MWREGESLPQALKGAVPRSCSLSSTHGIGKILDERPLNSGPTAFHNLLVQGWGKSMYCHTGISHYTTATNTYILSTYETPDLFKIRVQWSDHM